MKIVSIEGGTTVRRPVVGVTGYIIEPEIADQLKFGPRQLDVTPSTYLAWLRDQGMLPVPVPYHPDGLHEDYLGMLDGLVLTGGADIDPARYGGGQPHPNATLEPRRDAFEFALLRDALERRMPVLGICRGLQMINVIRGGTLHQHLPDRSTELLHSNEFRDGERHPDEKWLPLHHDVLVEDPELRELTGPRLRTNTYHHQGVAQLGDGLRVAARSADGLVEAVVGLDRPLLGVQWHPEMHAADEPAGYVPFQWLARQLATTRGPVSPAPAGFSLN